MKLNNKGFAISSIMYIILILAVILISLTLALLSSRKLVLDKLKQEVLGDIYNELPPIYQQIEYIEVTGTQAIQKIYVIPSTYETIEFVAKTSSSSISEQGIFGVPKKLEFAYSGTNRVAIWSPASGSLAITTTEDILNKPIILKATVSNGNKITLYNSADNGILVRKEAAYTPIENSNVDLMVYVGGENYYLQGRVYYAKIIVDGRLVRDMIPCYRKSDGVIGMYDLVEGNFYINTDSGDFVKGKDI